MLLVWSTRCFTDVFCVHADDLCNYGGTCFSVPGSEVHQLYLWQPSLGDQRPPKQKLHRASQSSLRYCQLEPVLLRQVPLCPAQPERDREAVPAPLRHRNTPVSHAPRGFRGGSFKPRFFPPKAQCSLHHLLQKVKSQTELRSSTLLSLPSPPPFLFSNTSMQTKQILSVWNSGAMPSVPVLQIVLGPPVCLTW